MADKINFTQAAIDKLPLPAAGRAYYADAKTPGLVLCVSDTGVKTFQLYRRIAGRPTRLKIGRFPEVTVGQARKEVARMTGEIAQGKDPAEDRRKARGETTLGELFALYLDGHAKPHKRTWKEDEAQYKRYLALWKTRKLSSIKRADVAALHAKIGRDKGRYAANRLLALVSVIFNYAASLGYRIKLLAAIKEIDGSIQLSVHPSLIPETSLLGHVNGVFNAVWVRGDVVGTTMYYGRGAGREATSSAVVADVVDIGLNLLGKCSNRLPAFPVFDEYKGLISAAEVVSRYYLRLQVADRPGMLAIISGILGRNQISIASVTQKEEGSQQAAVPMVILTHKAKVAAMNKAIEEISRDECIHAAPVVFRIEDLG